MNSKNGKCCEKARMMENMKFGPILKKKQLKFTKIYTKMTKEEIKALLLNYTLWLDRRGAFSDDLQIDWEHQIDTFLDL